MFLETCTAEVSSDRTTQGSLPMECGPQGLRRPRFSFFRFSCQTAREPCGPLSPKNRRAAEARDIRPKSAVWSPRWMRCFAGASSRRKAGGAPLWGLYSRGVTGLSTLEIADFDSNRTCGKRRFHPYSQRRWVRPRAALVPHSSRVVRVGVRPVIAVRIKGVGQPR